MDYSDRPTDDAPKVIDGPVFGPNDRGPKRPINDEESHGIAFVHPVSKKVVFVVAPWMKIAPDPNEDIFSLDERIEGRW